MFYHIEGTVSDILPNLAVVDCGGVGYAINTTANSLSQISLGKTAKFYTFDYIKEDCFDLYGFTTKQEKHSFELLISISGVGPKAAISILSCTTPEMFAMAVMSDDVKVLTAAPGIGKKIAQRVILELKDKISKETPLHLLRPLQQYRPAQAMSSPMRSKVFPYLDTAAMRSIRHCVDRI